MALSQREKALLALPVVLGGLLGYYHWVHEPLFARRAEARDLSEQVMADLRRDQARLAREGDLEARHQAVGTREQLIDAWVPGKNSAALFIWYLSQAERKSGVRIKGINVAERKEIVAKPPEAQVQGAAAQPQPGVQAPTLTVIRLELKVDARFTQHLLFNQGLEEMPLFLNTNALSLERAEKSPAERVGKLVEEGESWLAAQILSTSPPLDGVYHVNLYFKSGKAGPTTDTMHFEREPGKKVDPFVMDNVDEFIQALVEYYSVKNADKGDPANAPGGGRNQTDTPGAQYGQMG